MEGEILQENEALIQLELDKLRSLTHTDFAALAFSYRNELIRWKYASGNRNERYRRIVLRPGKGIAGKVVQSARPVVLNSFTLESRDDPREYPILLAENLKSMLGVPVVSQDWVLGVLLVGYRTPIDFNNASVEFVSDYAHKFETLIQVVRVEQS